MENGDPLYFRACLSIVQLDEDSESTTNSIGAATIVVSRAAQEVYLEAFAGYIRTQYHATERFWSIRLTSHKAFLVVLPIHQTCETLPFGRHDRVRRLHCLEFGT